MMERTHETRIAVIMCYFGKAPNYLPYFFESCRHNPDIDFFLFTDIKRTPVCDNIKVFRSSLDDMSRLATIKLGMDIHLHDAYKLCDLKPTYGLLFEDYIAGYDFWGHGDVDLVYGSIRRHFTDAILDSYDILSAREEYISGFFCLYRNVPEINRLFQKSRHHQLVFQNQEYFGFDECNFRFRELWSGTSILDLPADIESMSHIVKREERSGHLKVFFKTLADEGVPGTLRWDQGRLFDLTGRKEILLFHLISIKNMDDYRIPRWRNIPKKYYITGFSYLRQRPVDGWAFRLSKNACRLLFGLRRFRRRLEEFWGALSCFRRSLPFEKFRSAYSITGSPFTLQGVEKKLLISARNGPPLVLRPFSPKKYKGRIDQVSLCLEITFDNRNEPYLATIYTSGGLRVTGRLLEATAAPAS